MTIGVVIISHDEVGSALLKAAVSTIGMCPLQTEVISVHRTDETEELKARALSAVEMVDHGDGVLVLTDMYGSTPSNIAASVLSRGKVRAVAGLNLPMLIRIFNYPRLDLDQLAQKAVAAGREGVMGWSSAEPA